MGNKMNQYKPRTKSLKKFLKKIRNQNKYSSICVLNDDSLRHVFSFLPVVDRIRIQRVCERWQTISKLPWSDLKELDCNFDIDKDRYSLIKLPTIVDILDMCGNYINKLVLPDYNVAPGTALVKLVKKKCPNLRSISFRGVTITSLTAQYLADNFDNFTEIKLGYNRIDCEDLISQFLSKNTKLRTIEFRGCRLNGTCMASLSAESLNEIFIESGDNFYPENVQNAFQNFKNLRLLSICDSDQLLLSIESYLQALPNKFNLEKLILKCQIRRTKTILQMNNIGLFENLRELVLCGNGVLHDKVLTTVGAHCNHLLTAAFYDSGRVSDLGLQSIVELPNLEQLIINKLNKVTDFSFDGKDISSLKDLRCYDCNNITNDTFDHVLRVCRSLQRLDVVGCTIDEKSLIDNVKKFSSKQDSKIEKPLQLYLPAIDNHEEVLKVSSRLRILRKKTEFFFELH